MEIAILGGGIAGLAAAIHLRQLGYDPVVYEREAERVRHGHGFILLEEGLASLDAFGLAGAWHAKGERIERFILRRPDGTAQAELPLTGAYGFRRSAFVDLLEQALPADRVRMGRRVQGVDYEPARRRVRSVSFADGARLEADLFIEAVGKDSAIRAALHPGRAFGPVLVREMVSHTVAPDMADILATRFLKYQDPRGGVAVGLVPCGQGQLLWYLQFDAARFPFTGTTGAEKAAFAHRLVGEWAEPIAELIRRTDFELSYVWNTSDLDPLPDLHGANAMLIGDAAHPFLPFTSQGVNAALTDVRVLGAHLVRELGGQPDAVEPVALERALAGYSRARLPEITRIVASGRELRERFLHPDRFPDGGGIPISK